MKQEREKNLNSDGVEIDIKRVFRAIWRRAWIVAVCAILCAAIALVGTIYLITPKYQSTAMFYVNNGALSVGDASFSITSGDITAAKSLVDTYIVILNSRACLTEVIDYANLDRSYTELRSMIAASSVNETEVFQVVVTSPDPAEAELIANTIAKILPKNISDIVEGTSANVVDFAIQATVPSSPNNITNTVAGFLIGGVLAVVCLAVREIFDTTIRTEEDIEQCCSHPILAAVPDMAAPSKGGYYRSYGKYAKYGKYSKKYAYAANGTKQQKPTQANDKTATLPIIGKDISFAALEAYKLLRTKLQFSFVDGVRCPVIGISSAIAGEGKSLSSINLAYSLSQLEKRVLLIDCDMRRPSLSVKLPIKKTPGLSEFLTGHATMDDVTQLCRVDTEGGFAVVASGRNPPNPIELLSSAKMANAINQLRDFFDYIILDLPPVGEVSDAMVAAKLTDGILLVVRQDYCSTTALTNAINQFDFIESRILGLVLNCVGEHGGRYYRYGYGKKYGRYYYGRYSRYSKYRYSSAYAPAPVEPEAEPNAKPQSKETPPPDKKTT